MADNSVPQGVTLTPINPQSGNQPTQAQSQPQGNQPQGGGVPNGVTLTPITPGSQPTGASNTDNTEQPGFWGRTYETSGIKGAVDLGKQVIGRPIDLYHQSVAAFKAGDWKTGTEKAYQLTGVLADKDNPLAKAAENLLAQPLEEIKAGYKQNREAGMGPVQAAVTPSASTQSVQGAKTLQKNLADNNYSAAIGDMISNAGGSHTVGAVPVIGPAVQQITSLLGKDIKDKNWKAVAGDAFGPMLTMGLGKILEGIGAGAGSTSTLGDVTDNAVRPGTTNIAGVDVPTTTASVADQSAASKALTSGASATGAQGFIEKYTTPAAAKANVSNMAQSAIDSANELRSIRGEAPVSPVLNVIDGDNSIVSFLKNEAKTTYSKLDNAVKPDIDAWNQANKDWHDNNPRPEKPPTGPSPTVGTPATATQKAAAKAAYTAKVDAWEQDEANWLEDNPKPKTFAELQDQIGKAEDTIDSKFSSQVDKNNAIKNLPKFRQEMTDFMNRYGASVNPNELTTADNLWARSKRFEWVANRVRTATTGELPGTNTGALKPVPLKLDFNRLKTLPNQFDTKFGSGTWNELLGSDGVKNYNDILRALQNPISGQVPFDVYIRDYIGDGVVLRGGRKLLSYLPDHLLFNPEFGQTALNLWKSSAKAAAPAAKAAPAAIATQPKDNTAVKQKIFNSTSLAGNQ